jgi:hypothetical protein
MRDYAVHEEPKVGGPRGLRRVILPVRRLLCRILRPIFLRLADLLGDLDGEQQRLAERQERMGEQVDALLNQGWDQTALLRRVGALEQQVEEMMQRVATQESIGDEAARRADYAGYVETPAGYVHWRQPRR